MGAHLVEPFTGGGVEFRGDGGVSDAEALMGTDVALDHQPPQGGVAMPEIQHPADPFERAADADPEQGGDIGGDELPDQGCAIRTTLHPAFTAFHQHGFVDIVEVTQGGDRQALGDLAGPDRSGGMIQRGRRIGHRLEYQFCHDSTLSATSDNFGAMFGSKPDRRITITQRLGRGLSYELLAGASLTANNPG